MSGDDGDDTLIGDDGDDLLLGGSNDDILIGGGGNDNFFGDEEGSFVYRDWSLTRQVTTDVNNVTQYISNFNRAGIQTSAVGGNDVMRYDNMLHCWIDQGDMANPANNANWRMTA